MKVLAYALLLFAAICLALGGWALYAVQGLFGFPCFRFVALANIVASMTSMVGLFLLYRSRRGQPKAELATSTGSPVESQANGIWALIGTAAVALGGGIGLFGNDQFSFWTLLLVFLLGGGAIALAQFVKRHGDEIGEARFDTRNPEERQP